MIFDLLRSYFLKSVRQAAEDGAMTAVAKHLQTRVPEIIMEVAKEKFAANPHMLLSNAGFGMAMALELQGHWPDLDTETAAKWMWDYIGGGYEVAKSDWTPATAGRLARDYVSKFGEDKSHA